MTPTIHSSHDLSRPEAKRFRVKLTNLNVAKIDLVEVFIDLLEAENLKSKNLADEYGCNALSVFIVFLKFVSWPHIDSGG